MSLPSSTYRLQLHGGFPFKAAEERIAYFSRLGIGAAYLSPILLARPGSPHGYDICDHNRINPELGGESGFRELAESLRGAGLGCLVDYVPNHMGADPASNPWWWDVLENGPSSPYGRFYDIDWEPIKPDLKGKVLLPVLGDQYGRILERGEMRLRLEEGGLVLGYYEHTFPINPRMAPLVLAPDGDSGVLPFGEDSPEGMEYLSILTSLRNMPAYLETEPSRIKERQREKEIARKRMAALARSSEAVREFMESRVRIFNGDPGDPGSFDRLHDLLERQAYRLAYWRTAGHEINYRRFFDINGLLGVRMEFPEVRAATHGLLMNLAREGLITGIRLDHIDGLYDPVGYLRSLRAMLAEATRDPERPDPEPASATRTGSSHYVVVEKILTGEESLPAEWPVEGMTGYEFLNDLNGLFVNPAGASKLHLLFRKFTNWSRTYGEEVRECKRLVLDTSMGSELNVLANLLDRLSETDRNCRDFTLETLRDVLREVIASFPVYRSYGSGEGFSEADQAVIDSALTNAASFNPALEPSVFAFLRSVLIPFEGISTFPSASFTLEQRIDFAMKFQQLTGPVQAKGVEDTVFYRVAILLSLNDVGGEPDSAGHSARDFHDRIADRAKRFPYAMLATATHDTKRGEDARARLNLLSEFPEAWRHIAFQLSRMLAARKEESLRDPLPSRADQYLLFQSLLGCWPIGDDGEPVPADSGFHDRVQEFMRKAVREAKSHSSWINPNVSYENGLSSCIEFFLLGTGRFRFQRLFFPFLQFCAKYGAVNSLGQLACKIGAPGVPDIYQGTETWDLSMVDPDNRRPVDYAFMEARLEAMGPYIDPALEPDDRRAFALELAARWYTGEIKQYLMARCLRWRAAHPELFLRGAYLPVYTDAGKDSHWVAFRREWEGNELIVCFRIRSSRSEAMAKSGAPEEIPQTEQLLLPAKWAGGQVENLFTGDLLPLESGKEACLLDIAGIPDSLPVAWLRLRDRV